MVVASVSTDASFEEFPIFHHSLDTSGVNVSRTYDLDSQAS